MAIKAHRAGPLKQANKLHKTGGHRSKGAVDALNRGRVNSSNSSLFKAKHAGLQSKLVKKHKMKQIRQMKQEIIQNKKKAISSGSVAPHLVVVIPLIAGGLECSLIETIANLLKDQSNAGDWIVDGQHVQSPQKFRRRFHFVQPNPEDSLAILDATKVCDSVVYIVDENVGLSGEKIITSVAAQGVPTGPVFVMMSTNNKKGNADMKSTKKWIDQVCPNATGKCFQLSNEQGVVQLLRHLGDLKKSNFSNLRSHRAHMLAEHVDFCPGDNAMGVLKIQGYVRGDEKWNVNRLIHIPGWGDFQLEKVEKLADPRALLMVKKSEEMTEVGQVVPSLDLQDSLVSENEPDPMEGEQTWPTDEELQECSSQEKKKTKRLVPKGTSEYQAAWIIDEQVENEDENEEDENMVQESDEEESEESDEESEEEEMENKDMEEEEEDNDYDTKHVQFVDEQDAYAKIKAARQDEMFPDEVDTPLDMPAKDRFQKYRGLKSFRSSPWDAKENLPLDYSRIFQFENFMRTKKNVLAANDEEAHFTIPSGTYCTLYIRNVPSAMVQSWNADIPLVVFSMLKHENKMSVVNVAVKRIIDPLNSDAIASKERLIFHVGYRRYAAQPIFSAHTNANKHKYERFWRPDELIVMSMYAPIMYPPANVLVYRELASGRQSLVGTGNLLSVAPERLVIKRSVLSGHPFKIHKRSATVRFMFFNRQDIEWFKPVELRTKEGRRGHIREPLGTHGHMKVLMDKPISQQDTILMNLYKRVFPKWTYDPFVNRHIKTNKLAKTSKSDECQPMEA